jgi:hypothetical protein
MPPAGFEPAVPASERSQTHALNCAATGITNTRSSDTGISAAIETIREFDEN